MIGTVALHGVILGPSCFILETSLSPEPKIRRELSIHGVILGPLCSISEPFLGSDAKNQLHYESCQHRYCTRADFWACLKVSWDSCIFFDRLLGPGIKLLGAPNVPNVHYLGVGFPSVCRNAPLWLAKSGVPETRCPFSKQGANTNQHLDYQRRQNDVCTRVVKTRILLKALALHRSNGVEDCLRNV